MFQVGHPRHTVEGWALKSLGSPSTMVIAHALLFADWNLFLQLCSTILLVIALGEALCSGSAPARSVPGHPVCPTHPLKSVKSSVPLQLCGSLSTWLLCDPACWCLQFSNACVIQSLNLSLADSSCYQYLCFSWVSTMASLPQLYEAWPCQSPVQGLQSCDLTLPSLPFKGFLLKSYWKPSWPLNSSIPEKQASCGRGSGMPPAQATLEPGLC